MTYKGAAEYYFWNGVLAALFGSIRDAEEYLECLDMFGNNATTVACYEAYEWGLCFGLTLSDVEYAELTSEPKEVNILKDVEKLEKIVKNDEKLENTVNSKVVGNC